MWIRKHNAFQNLCQSMLGIKQGYQLLLLITTEFNPLNIDRHSFHFTYSKICWRKVYGVIGYRDIRFLACDDISKRRFNSIINSTEVHPCLIFGFVFIIYLYIQNLVLVIGPISWYNILCCLKLIFLLMFDLDINI